jgi:hypothetical protein
MRPWRWASDHEESSSAPEWSYGRLVRLASSHRFCEPRPSRGLSARSWPATTIFSYIGFELTASSSRTERAGQQWRAAWRRCCWTGPEGEQYLVNSPGGDRSRHGRADATMRSPPRATWCSRLICWAVRRCRVARQVLADRGGRRRDVHATRQRAERSVTGTSECAPRLRLGPDPRRPPQLGQLFARRHRKCCCVSGRR